MKALQMNEPGTFNIVETDLPVCQDHEVLIETEIVSTCPRWDLNMMAGRDMFDAQKSPEYPLPPGFPGHELAGTVIAAGKSVHTLRIGDRVAALEHTLPGYGGYSQFYCHREEDVIKLPDSISFKQSVSFELLKCVLIGLQQLGDIRGKSILISGLGPAGLLAMQAAKLWGASSVTAVDVSPKRINYARQLGVCEALHVDELANRRFQLGYDCVGYAASVQNVLEHTDEHAVIFGVLKGDITYPEKLWLKGTKLESYKYRKFGPRDRELLLDLVAHKGLNTECLQTHELTFTQYHEAIELLKSQEAIKVCFYPKTGFDE